jgi:hypothetical protein
MPKICLIEPGGTIQQVVGGQTATLRLLPPLLVVIVGLFMNRYRIVAVTGRRIVVLDAGKWSQRTARW